MKIQGNAQRGSSTGIMELSELNRIDGAWITARQIEAARIALLQDI